ncbi:MAG: DUF1778 domain-containing protein, partial [Planctomycetes bacterium]|nr:DUF1778 domain-containing protein [Planctomycetota bacterium]
MPRAAVNDNHRIALRVRPADKALIMRAAALAETDMTTFVLRTALREAQKMREEHERVQLSRRDSRLVMELLENPASANAKLRRAARSLPPFVFPDASPGGQKQPGPPLFFRLIQTKKFIHRFTQINADFFLARGLSTFDRSICPVTIYLR